MKKGTLAQDIPTPTHTFPNHDDPGVPAAPSVRSPQLHALESFPLGLALASSKLSLEHVDSHASQQLGHDGTQDSQLF